MLKLKLQYFGHLMQRADSFEKTLIWERLKTEGEGDDRGWDGWMASLTRWKWVWVDSGSWWWIGRPGVLWIMGSQRVKHDWVTELNWTNQYCCSITNLCPTLCNPIDCSLPGFPILHNLLEFAQTHVHWVGDAIHPSHPLSSPSLPAFDLTQHQSLFQWVSSSHKVAKVLEL